MRLPGWIAVIAGGVLAGLFAFANRFERVSVELGFTRLYAVPLAVFFFAAFLLGMAAMLVLSLPQDRRTRELLRAHGLLGTSLPRPAPRPRAAEYEPVHAPSDRSDAAGS